MNTLLLQLVEFEKKLERYTKQLEKEKEEKIHLAKQKSDLNHKLANQIHLTKELQNENDRLKIVNAMLGDKEHRRLMKLRMNKLLKEIDECMVLIRQKQ